VQIIKLVRFVLVRDEYLCVLDTTYGFLDALLGFDARRNTSNVHATLVTLTITNDRSATPGNAKRTFVVAEMNASDKHDELDFLLRVVMEPVEHAVRALDQCLKLSCTSCATRATASCTTPARRSSCGARRAST